MNGRIVVLARAPEAAGKSRLCAGLRAGAARRLREALFLDTLEAVLDADVPVAVVVTPADALDATRTLAARDRGVSTRAVPVTWTMQADGDLGVRMASAIGDALEAGASRVVLVGSDLPSLPAAHLVRALDALEGSDAGDVVLGPATDGGYYLVGARRRIDGLFADVPWGTPDVFETTRARAADLGLAVRTVPAWFDVDTRDDLQRIVASTGAAAPRTRAWAAGHWRAAHR